MILLFLNGSLYWSSRHPDILYQQSGRCSNVLVEFTTLVQQASMQYDVQWKPVCRKMCFLRVRFTVSLKRNSGSTNSQMTSLRPPAASLSSQMGAGQAVDYLSTCFLLSTGQAVDNNAVCLSGQRSRDPVIRIHLIWPFLSYRVLFVDT